MFTLSIEHKGLRRFVQNGDKSGLPPAAISKLTVMLSFLPDMSTESELERIPSWRAHRLAGQYRGYWSLSVSRNWRLVFIIRNGAIHDLDLLDYH